MLKRIGRYAHGTLAVVAALAVVMVVTVLIVSRRTFDAPYPPITASHDPKVIARGKYIAYSVAHCVNCHTPESQNAAIAAGATPALIGGRPFRGPFGVVWTPNLTPDVETGIGRYSDAELARILRHGVLPDGRAALPFMELQNASDEDLLAVVSFLRSQPAVRNDIRGREFNLLGKAILAFAIKPIGPSEPVRAHTPQDGTLESGEYLATAVANCESCHTKRNMLTGAYVNAQFSGGMTFPLDDKRVIVTPTLLTPAKAARITSWDEEQFVGRFGAAASGIPGSHMPWKQFQTLTETDVRSIYRYLRTLPPVEHDPGPSLQSREEQKKKDRNA